jgi:Dolichyl-phosphate-mannose-protein mannosyltransferase
MLNGNRTAVEPPAQWVELPAAASRTSKFSRTSRVLVPVLLLVFILQCAWFIRTQSFTVDEPEHIVAGLEAWRFGEFERWHDQPPLARLLFALPLLRTHWKYEIGKLDEEVHPLTPAPEVWLYRARSMNVLLGVALLLVFWLAARQLFSESAATFALALAVLSPDLVAHFSLATIDGAGTLFIFVAVAQLIRWRHCPTRGQTLLLGVALGLMLLAKFNSPPLFLLALFLVLSSKPEGLAWGPKSWNWGKATTAGALAFLVVWAGYFFHISKVLFEKGMVTLHFAGYTKLLTYPMPTPKHLTIFIPACEYLTGLGMVIYHNATGHRSIFLGQISPTGGWKLYFPVAVLLKWPLIILLLGAAGALLLFRRRFPGRSDLLLMSLFPVLYFALSIFTRINIGVRHVLPVYPFLLLYAAGLWEWARRRKIMPALLLVLLSVQAADCLRYAPDYLSYFNVFVNPAQSYKLLSDSNLDWGQGLVALRKYQEAHQGETLHLAYFGLVDPAWYGIRYVPLGEGERVTGTVVVSATHLSGQLLKDPTSYRWLLAHPRKAILNHTLHVFEVPASALRP